jgi:hypothetical protein
MNNTAHAPTIRCWTTDLLVVTVTVVAAAGASGRGYAIEARTWAGAIVAAVTVTGQGVALRLARRLARSQPSAALALAGAL